MARKKSVAATAPAAMTKRARPAEAESPVKEAGERATAKKSGRQRGPKSVAVAKRDERQKAGNTSFPVAGIGASAGGLEAFRQLLENLPVDTGMAFVLVSHLDPTHKSILTELLARSTRLPVSEVSDGMKVEPDHVYVMPPNTSMAIAEGVLRLRPREEGRAGRHPVDYFLRTLAEDQCHQAIGVILSGTDTDGTLGLESIKAEGGITFAENPKSAKYDGMPRSAIAAGHVDFILTPEGIAEELARISRHPYVSPVATPVEEEQQPTGRSGFRRILALLHKAKGVDFTNYKANTLRRRIGRRVVLNKLASMEDYARYLRESAAEVEGLYRDILISVTSFFRNPETFEVLKERIIPQVVEQRTPDEPLRIWTLGCSTGEEAYSIAISFAEFAGDQAEHMPVQIFATDLSDQGIEKARAGFYSKDIAKDVSPERLQRFFTEADGGYRVSKPIRDMIVFARQNVIADPPFSRLDLISCRNLLIYLEPVLQKQVLPTLHYALKPTGVLWLGTSETVGATSDLFAPEGKQHRFYSKKPASAHWHFQRVLGDAARQSAGSGQKIGHVSEQLRGEHDAQKEADRILLARYSPAGVVINAEMEILQVRGSTGAYLESPAGKATFNLLKMAREGLMLPLRVAIQKAKKDDQTIRKEGVRVNYDGEFRQVNLEVIPIKGLAPHERCFLVLFEPAAEGSGRKAVGRRQKAEGGKQKAGNRQAARLQEELAVTREYMQSLVEQHEAANEELQSANEEIQSSNEELHSINEELETAKEELESGNEELTTLNDELQNRNQELTTLNNDLNNLHVSVNIPILMLGRDLRIRRFTPQAEKVLSLIQADVGRPVGNIKLNINVPDLEELVAEVIDTVSVKEREVHDRHGHWYLMRVRPYKTLDNRIDGAVVVLVDINALKRSESEIRESRDYAEAIIGTVREPLIVLDENLRVQTANRSFYEDFQVTPEETENRLFFDLGDRQWDIPKLRTLLEEILPENNQFQDFEVEHEFEHIGRRTVLLNGRHLEHESSRAPLILLAIEDITERNQTEQALREAHDELEKKVQQRTAELLAANAFLRNEIGERKGSEEALRKTKETLETIFDAAPVAILGLDLEGRITNWSSGAQQMFGWGAEETIGRLCPTVPEDGLADFKAMIDLVVGEGPQTGMVYVRQKKNSQRIQCSISSGPLRDAARKVTGVTVILEDITELKQAEEERAHLLQRIVSAQEEEQRRLSRELHDQMGQSIAALLLGLKSLDDSSEFRPVEINRLHQLQELTNQLAHDVHHLASSLRPTALDDLGLHTALLNHVEEWSERTKIGADFHSNGLIKQRLPPQVETTVYRIVQEALTNVLKHANAQNVSIIVEHRGNRVMAIVEDDGSGFDVEAMMDKPMIDRRLGLMGMKERVSLVGGRLDIESTPSAGTTVIVHIPISSPQLENPLEETTHPISR